jgi:hypothetical protein
VAKLAIILEFPKLSSCAVALAVAPLRIVAECDMLKLRPSVKKVFYNILWNLYGTKTVRAGLYNYRI